MLLHLSTWAEIEARLTQSKTVVVPIGSNEQHGPTGLLGTDWLCPEIIAHEAHRTGDILIGPTFNIGMAQHHLDFPGTIALRPSTFMLAIGDWCRSLSHAGFERIFFLNGHGGNVATIEAAFSELYAEASYAGRRRGFACKLKNWWELRGVGALAARVSVPSLPARTRLRTAAPIAAASWPRSSLSRLAASLISARISSVVATPKSAV
jgi:creatinine amidohydrolase/Fe(II)-dependent formamide hydrolase-like protein